MHAPASRLLAIALARFGDLPALALARSRNHSTRPSPTTLWPSLTCPQARPFPPSTRPSMLLPVPMSMPSPAHLAVIRSLAAFAHRAFALRARRHRVCCIAAPRIAADSSSRTVLHSSSPVPRSGWPVLSSRARGPTHRSYLRPGHPPCALAVAMRELSPACPGLLPSHSVACSPALASVAMNPPSAVFARGALVLRARG
ncbi:uncharacterized protein C8Q71DRAFT_374463 [Rhodofomes roseus]|uniref:Uncharacterized protein n=1 Tax=Rhodofomes roseus TaxID=34475 RepID=A0ABQ8K0V9_9APHY|nr:uncharacterized protein C8Q71DRAFT_374463 [Rhodofomes roseus]KAH9830304.1 hypothetical protein C8Q71DRAFT_374463 [Rhodofomes roseus]